MSTNERLRRALVALVIWTAAVTIVSGVAFMQARWAREDLEKQSIANCREIEQVKKGGRDAAWRDFNQLSVSLKILKIEKTDEIKRTARNTRNRRLRQFKAEPCPREIVKP